MERLTRVSATPDAPARALRVLVTAAHPAVRAGLAAALEAVGHPVVATAATGTEAVALAAALGPDVVLLELHLPGGSGADAAALIAGAAPAPGIVLLTGSTDEALGADVAGVGAVAVLALSTPRALLDATVRCAAARARDLTAARADAAAARRQLAERKVIERAKGILMRRTGTTEQEAYRILQRSSQDRATPMVTLAQAVIDSEPGATAPV